MSRKSFTLVEMLVVIGIVGSVAGMVLPAVQNARRAASRLKCMNNMKQLGMAVQDSEAANGFLPPGQTAGYDGVSWFWYGVERFPNGTGEAPVIDTDAGYLMPYAEANHAILVCPEACGLANETFLWSDEQGGYGYNSTYLSPRNLAPAATGYQWHQRTSDQFSASTTVCFADAARVEFPNGPPCLVASAFVYPPSVSAPAVQFRHNGTANVVWLDGHAESLSHGTRNRRPWQPEDEICLENAGRVFDIGSDDSLWGAN